MYTKYKYSLRDLLMWTRFETGIFLVIALIPTVLYDVAGLHWLRLPWTPIALVGTAVAFLIGFQNNAAYGRTWEARKIWGGIVNASRTWAIQTRAMVTREHAKEALTDEEIQQHRTTLIHRHFAWMTALRYALRTPKPWEAALKSQTNKEWHDKVCIPERDGRLEDDLRPLLSETEYAHVMKNTNKAAATLALQSRHLLQLKEQGLLWGFSFLKLQELLQELMTLQGKSERIKNFPYPRQYSTVGHELVRTFVFLLPFGVIPEFAKIGELIKPSHPLIGNSFIWLAIPFSVIVSWVFNTMQRIGIVGENPFEGSPNDVPISTMARGIEIDMREMNDEDAEQIPDPYPIVHGVQM